ncbi:hypothetical protein Tco_0394497 [Tanacetum coccineum]
MEDRCLGTKPQPDQAEPIEDINLNVVTRSIEQKYIVPVQQVINSPCFLVKSWLVQDQTVLGKDYSNLLIADSLLKTIWFINQPSYDKEAIG